MSIIFSRKIKNDNDCIVFHGYMSEAGKMTAKHFYVNEEDIQKIWSIHWAGETSEQLSSIDIANKYMKQIHRMLSEKMSTTDYNKISGKLILVTL